jgi:hypothetical protein
MRVTARSTRVRFQTRGKQNDVSLLPSAMIALRDAIVQRALVNEAPTGIIIFFVRSGSYEAR